MQQIKNLRVIGLNIAIFLLPFLEFIKDNFNEKDIILTESFFYLTIIFCFILVLLSYFVFLLKRELNFLHCLLISTISFYLLFKHNLFKTIINFFFGNENPDYNLSSEISLILVLILIITTYRLIKNNNIFFKRFSYVFFYLSLILILFQLFFFQDVKKIDLKSSSIIYSSTKDIKKNNIYFVILDAMIPIKNFEKHYDMSLNNFINDIEDLDYKYIHDTNNLYDNTAYNLTSLFNLDEILKNDELPQNKYLYPSMLRNIEKTNLFKNLSSLEYNFKWAGNLFAYCPKFNLRYCLDKDKKGIIDIYLSLNFLQKSPFIPIATHLANFFNFNFNKYLFFELNDGIGRLVNFLINQENNIEDKPNFYFIHHMSPHYPYVTDKDCSYKFYSGKKNFEGYKSAYLCNLKKIKLLSNYLNEKDPEAIVIFQSDHSWGMSKDKKEKKMIFNLIKLDENCKMNDDVNYHHVNTLRLVLSCLTNQNVNYLNN